MTAAEKEAIAAQKAAEREHAQLERHLRERMEAAPEGSALRESYEEQLQKIATTSSTMSHREHVAMGGNVTGPKRSWDDLDEEAQADLIRRGGGNENGARLLYEYSPD